MAFHLFFYAIIFFISLVLILVVGPNFSFKNRKKYHLPPSPTALPIIGHLHLIGAFPNISFQKLASRYGPLFHIRLGSLPCIVASSPQLAKELLMTNEKHFLTHPASIAIHNTTYDSSGFAFSPYGPYFQFIKKLTMSLLLGGQALSQLQPIRKDEIQRLVQLLAEKSNARQTVDLSEEFMKISNNIVTRMLLSNRYSAKEDHGDEMRTLIREISAMFGQFNLMDFFGFIPRFLDLQGIYKSSNLVRRRYDVVLEKIIKEREEIRKMKKKNKVKTSDNVGDEDRDFLDILLDALEDEKSESKITRDNIKAVILDIITGGTDTSAGAVEWALAELINHPNMFKKAREEIDLVIGSRLVEESDLSNLPYLQAIFKEVLRLHPPVPMLIRESTQDCKIGGYDIPANTRLFVNIWSISRDPNIWKDPSEFKPERFMTGDGDDEVVASAQNKDVRGQHFDFLPFGTGRRGCPGMWLSLVEVPTILAAMVQCFDWKVVGNNNNTVDMTERFGLTMPKAHPLVVVPVIRPSSFIKP